VETGQLFYQCVYLRCEDDAALSSAWDVAREVFGAPGSAGPTFMPHASVVYGLPGETVKEELCTAVRAWLEPLQAQGEAQWAPSALSLWHTEAGDTAAWREVAADVPF